MTQKAKKSAVKKSTPAKKPVRKTTAKPSNDNNRVIRAQKLNPDRMEVIDQIVYILSKSGAGKKASRKHLAAAILGAILGGFIPLASYVIAHVQMHGVKLNELYYNYNAYLVFGGLLYSSPTVYSWAKKAFGSNTLVGKVKPFGFVLLLEGVMITNSPHWAVTALSVAALSLLIFINGIASGCNLALKRTVDNV